MKSCLLNVDKNAKTVKGRKKGYYTAVLYLAPATVSGYQVCPKSTDGCRAACLNTAGRGQMWGVQAARVRKTKMFFEQRKEFMLLLEREISRFIRWTKGQAAKKHKKLIPVVRLNGTSDIKWESVSFVGVDGKTYKSMMDRFPTIQFYDYTKHTLRHPPTNYAITFSLAENNDADAKKALDRGLNVAVVFNKLPAQAKYSNTRVVNGDENDLRFLDPKRSIVALKAKGKARRDTSGFVRQLRGNKIYLPVMMAL